jgi:hypothetical protein
MRRAVVLAVALLTAAAPAGAKQRTLHRVAALHYPSVMSDGASVAAWQTALDRVTVRSHGLTRTSTPPQGSCGELLAVGSGRLLFWCGPNRLFVMNAASGATRTVVPNRDLNGFSARGQVPTRWAIGRAHVLMVWPDVDQRTQAEVDWRTGQVSESVPGPTNWLNLDAPGLFGTPCIPKTGDRIVEQRDGYSLLSREGYIDAELVPCAHPRHRKLLVGDDFQLGGGWLTWRDHRSTTSVSALRLRDMRLFRFRLRASASGIDPVTRTISVAHTTNTIFVADDLGGSAELRTGRLPRR